jgi:hypothetical protein
MNVHSSLKTAVDTLNAKWSKCGSVRVITWEEYVKSEYFSPATETYAQFLDSRGIRFQPAPDCIMVDYDFNDDELEDDERDEFSSDIDRLWDGLVNQGTPLYDHDGSGGGLYYGLNLYPAK